MNKILLVFIFFLFFAGCSTKSKLWEKDKAKIENPKTITKILNKNTKVENEFNANIKILVSKRKYNSNFFFWIT